MIIKHNYADGFDGLKTNRLVFQEAPEIPKTPDSITELTEKMAQPADTSELEATLEEVQRQAEHIFDKSEQAVPSGPKASVDIGPVTVTDGSGTRVEGGMSAAQAAALSGELDAMEAGMLDSLSGPAATEGVLDSAEDLGTTTAKLDSTAAMQKEKEA